MIKYYCDLCGKEVPKYNEYTLPIAATFLYSEPCDLVEVDRFTLCKDCKIKIYNTIKSIVPESKLKLLNELALNVKRERE